MQYKQLLYIIMNMYSIYLFQKHSSTTLVVKLFSHELITTWNIFLTENIHFKLYHHAEGGKGAKSLSPTQGKNFVRAYIWNIKLRINKGWSLVTYKRLYLQFSTSISYRYQCTYYIRMPLLNLKYNPKKTLILESHIIFISSYLTRIKITVTRNLISRPDLSKTPIAINISGTQERIFTMETINNRNSREGHVD